jgi:hypothetical protein
MAGGTFTTYNKRRPGAYINVNAPQKSVGSTDTTRGVVFFIGGSSLGWGANGVIKLNAGSNFKQALGVDLYADTPSVVAADGATVTANPSATSTLIALRETLKAAATVLFYNTNTGNKATYESAELPWKFTAKYPGTVGNAIQVGVTKDPANEAQYIVTTYFGSELVDKQIIKSAEQLTGTAYTDVAVTTAGAEGTELLAALTAGLTKPLAGGVSDEPVADTDVMITDMETQAFNVVTAAGMAVDANIHQLLVSTVERLRDAEGQKVVAVIPDGAAKADYEGVIIVANGVTLDDGTVLTATQAAGYVAGAEAAAAVNESLTYAEYPNAVDVNGRLNNEDTIAALDQGKLLFTLRNNGTVVIEQDINSLHTYSANKSNSLSKNRVLRVLDDIAQNTKDTFETMFIGKVNNDGTGRDLFKANRIEYLNSLTNAGAIQAFDAEDISVQAGNDFDQVIVDLAVQPVDAMEKLYMTVTV